MRYNCPKCVGVFLWLVMSIFTFQSRAEVLKDSVGVKTIGKQFYILHEVESGQTLFAISRRYEVEVDLIFEANPEAKDGLNIGQIIKVPVQSASKTSALSKGRQEHIVEPSQTLFSISRQYNVSVEELKKWNALSSNSLDVGQRLLIKSSATQNQAEKTAQAKQVTAQEGQKLHEVKPSETLYSISRMYEVSIKDLKSWNKLRSNELAVGQKLVVNTSSDSEPDTLMASMESPEEEPEKKKQLQKKQIREKEAQFEGEQDDEIYKKEETIKNNENASSKGKSGLAKQSTAVSKSTDSQPIAKAETNKEAGMDTLYIEPRKNRKSRKGIDKVVEYGLAEVINGSVNTKKYLALHRSAPIGTVMKIRNETNNRSIYVRVLGRLPDTGGNEKIVVKISRAAFDKLGGINKRFPVEMSYVR